MKEWKYNCVAVVAVSILCVRLIRAQESCEEIGNYVSYHHSQSYYYISSIWSDNERPWHNMSFWGGHVQIPQKDKMDSECMTTYGNTVVLTDNHPDVATMNENVVTVQACSLNQNGVCNWDMDVQMRKCHGDLLYSFPWFDSANEDTWNHYICFDVIYADTCDDTSMVYSAGTVSGKYLHLFEWDYHIQTGWYDAFHDGKQFVPPSFEDINDISFLECYMYGFGFCLQEPLPQVTDDTPTRLIVCEFGYADIPIIHHCDYFVYVRACNGKLQFDFSGLYYFWYFIPFCLIHHNNVKVQPEIGHDVHVITLDGRTVRTYDPFLQYRCSFDAIDGALYKANWYINGTLQIELGPSSSTADLVFKEEYLKHLKPGYEVQCGIITASGNESIELLSDAFYAGWKITDNSISLSKSGYTIVEIEQTIPLGCYYSEDDATINCKEELTFLDPSYVPDICAGGIRVQNADDATKSAIEIQSLRKDEEWSSETHRVKLSTYDSSYDDHTVFDLQIAVTHSAGHASRRSVSAEIVGAIHVEITDANRHWNKRCYSHVDPHVKTVDGLHIEAQQEGDYMLVRNEEFQTEIQTSARYCSGGFSGGPVCDCGIAIAVGADAFIIDKCPDSRFKFDYVQCGDGGIIDVEKIHDYRYKVRTPIGTVIDILLHTWSDTMNIDIFMSAKDFGNVVGLCGYFDGNRTNDLLHRDGTTISYDNNWSYEFADSWRLTDEENLFKHNNRYLKQWNLNNGGTDQPCSRPASITRKKCKFNRRKRRATSDHQRKEMTTQSQILLSRNKRSPGNFTEDEAFTLCNHSIYSTPAVREFPDKLAEEDPDEVVAQCVYDLTQGNDSAWVEAHTTVLNNAVDTVLQLNPVYVANNTDIVNAFRLQTCLNNCSGNGACTETGLCNCNGTFRGPDCSCDIRIPPVVYYIEGDGICEVTEGDDCTCFQIRTNNIFDGFMCDISRSKVYFNGTRVTEVSSRHTGDYEDIFTGECCAPTERKKRSDIDDVDDLFVIMYEFAVSNDGVNYGETNTVFVYDTTCLHQVATTGNVTFELKTGYCFIDATCVVHDSSVLNIEECFLCDPATDPYSWTKGTCEESSSGLSTGALIGIIFGCLLVVVVTGILVYLLGCKGSKKHRAVRDVQSNLQTTLAAIHLPDLSKPDKQSTDMHIPNAEDDSDNRSDTATVFPDLSNFGAAKPVCGRNMWTGAITTPHADMDYAVPTVERSCSSMADDVLEYKITDEDKHSTDTNADTGCGIPEGVIPGHEQPERVISVVSLKMY